MSVVSMKSLLESGVHFGHRTNKWHPAMKPYIFTERNNIHIIDLQQTVKSIEHAYELVRKTVADGGTVLFVGTKRQAQDTIETEAKRCNMPYVIYRWLGGTLTNWRTIRERINELERLERMRDSGEFEHFTKKETLIFNRKIERLEMLLGGVRNMAGLPDLLFVVDVRREETAIHEANLLKIPILAMVDTNCDPRNVDYIIPSNDDAIRAIKLMVSTIANAVIEGKALWKEDEALEEAKRLEVPYEIDMELSDEELLGEATLAKISASQQPEIEKESLEEQSSEELSEDAVSEEPAPEETEDTPETTLDSADIELEQLPEAQAEDVKEVDEETIDEIDVPEEDEDILGEKEILEEGEDTLVENEISEESEE